MKIKIILAIGFIMIATSSCKKSFIDLQPYNALPLPVATGSEANLYNAVNGLYSGLRSSNYYGRMLPVRGDLMADNTWIKLANSGRFLDFNDYNITVTNTNAQALWAQIYVVIKNANTVINTTLAPSVNVNHLRGEAYAVRALCYFDLLRNFSKPFTVDPNGLGVPIITVFDETLANLPTRNTTAEVYKLINDDLNQAYTLMTFNLGTTMPFVANGATIISRSINGSYFTKYSARALQAKVYMTMGDWANAKTAALDVVTNSGVSVVTNANYVAYWANPSSFTSKVETLFEITNDLLNNNGTNALAYMYDQNGYGDILATTDLVSKYKATDVRLQVVPLKSVGYVNNKYSNTLNANEKDDIKVLRISDVILILAEAYARTGDEPNARIRLNQIAQNRDPSFAGYASTGQQLIDDIILERRKELAFEGDRLFDLQRLNLAFTKYRRENPIVTIPIANNDFRRIFPIPTTETDVNPNIRAQQNPGY